MEVNEVLLDIELDMTPNEWISNLQRVFKPLVKLVLLEHRVVVDRVCQVIAKHFECVVVIRLVPEPLKRDSVRVGISV